MNALEDKKKGVQHNIDVEEKRAQMIPDEYSVKTFFEKFNDLDVRNDVGARKFVLDYLVEHIEIMNDNLILFGSYADGTGGRGVSFGQSEIGTLFCDSTTSPPSAPLKKEIP